MKFHQLQENSKTAVALAPVRNVTSDDQDGSAVDLTALPQFRDALVLCMVGTPTGGTMSIVFTLEAAGSDDVFAPVSGKTATRTSAGISEIQFDPNALPAGTTQIRLNRAVTISGGNTVETAAALILAAPSSAPVS